MTVLVVILPLGRTQFLDDAGEPIAGGSVAYYIPATSTPKDTWQDPEQGALNQNPVPLDAAGSAYVYGSGEYRMIVKDALGNTIYDALTNGVIPSSVSGAGFGTQEQLATDATTDLGTITTHNLLLTGNAVVSSFGNSASLVSPIYYCEVAVGFQVDYSSAIFVPGRAAYTFEGGDGFLCEFLGAGNWKIIAIWPKRGLASGFGLATDIVAANTTDIGAIDTNFANITAIANIASLGNTASMERPVYLTTFASTPTLVNSAALDLLGSANIVVVAGANALWQYLGAGNWKMLTYVNADGSPLFNAASPGRLLSITTYNAASVNNYAPPTGANLLVVTVTGGGASGASAGVGSSGHSMASPGGSAGASSQGQIAGPLLPNYVATVGAGGAPSAAGANDGLAGGASSLAALIVCGGGTAPSHGADATAASNAPSAGGALTTPGNIWAQVGQVAQNGVSVGSTFAWGGYGGGGPRGGGGSAGAVVGNASSQSGGPGRSAGAGGGGAVATSDGGAQSAAGGAGHDGEIIIEAYS